MGGPGFPNTQTHTYGISFTLSICRPSCAWRGVVPQSRSSHQHQHQPTSPVRTPRLPILLTLTDLLFFWFPHRLLHDLSVYIHTEGKLDSDAVRRSALLDYRRRLELELTPLVREHISFQPLNSLMKLTHHLPCPPPRMHKLSRPCPLAVPARSRPPRGPPRGAAALQCRTRATTKSPVPVRSSTDWRLQPDITFPQVPSRLPSPRQVQTRLLLKTRKTSHRRPAAVLPTGHRARHPV